MSRRSTRTRTSRQGDAGRSESSLRLIGGQWRGRRIAIHGAPGLRPTPDRVRETVFNWLAPIIEGAHCADLFAGTGALGLEALSRGAGRALFFDTDRHVIDHLERAVGALGASERATIVCGDAQRYAERNTHSTDIVFIDPPFDAHCHTSALRTALEWLRFDGHVYVEYPVAELDTITRALTPDFNLLKQRRAGRVGFALARVKADGSRSMARP